MATAAALPVDRVEDLAQRTAQSITCANEVRALARQLPSLTAAERERLVARWYQLRGLAPEPAPSAESAPEPTRVPDISINVPASLVGSLTPRALHTLAALLVLARGGRQVRAEIEAIAEAASVSRDTIKRGLGDLGQYVTRELVEGQSSRYTLSLPQDPQFIRVPASIVASLDSRALAQYLALRATTGQYETCSRSVRELAGRAGLGVLAGRSAQRRLVKAGLLSVRQHRYRESTYTIHRPGGSVQDREGVGAKPTGGRCRTERGSVQNREGNKVGKTRVEIPDRDRRTHSVANGARGLEVPSEI